MKTIMNFCSWSAYRNPFGTDRTLRTRDFDAYVRAQSRLIKASRTRRVPLRRVFQAEGSHAAREPTTQARGVLTDAVLLQINKIPRKAGPSK